MNLVEPIRDNRKIEKMKKYLKEKNTRDYTMFSLGLNVALRISDLLSLRFSDVLDKKMEFKDIKIREKKTGKLRSIKLSNNSKEILMDYIKKCDDFDLNDHIFTSRESNNSPIAESKFLDMLNIILKSKKVNIGKVDADSVKEIKDNIKIGYILDKVKENKNPVYYSILMLALYSDMKLSEILQLKTGDINSLDESLKQHLKEVVKGVDENDYVFKEFKGRTKPISRHMALSVIKEAAEYAGVKEEIGTHSLRKTWGWNLWQSGVNPVLIMKALNHSSLDVTERYLGITQQSIDELYDLVDFN